MNLGTSLSRVGAVAAIAAAGFFTAGCFESGYDENGKAVGTKPDVETCLIGAQSVNYSLQDYSFRIKSQNGAGGLTFSDPVTISDSLAIDVLVAPDAPIFLIGPEDPATHESRAYLCPAGRKDANGQDIPSGASFYVNTLGPVDMFNDIFFGEAPPFYPGNQLFVEAFHLLDPIQLQAHCANQTDPGHSANCVRVVQ